MVEYGLALLVLSTWILFMVFLFREGIYYWHLGRMASIMLSSKIR